MLSEVNAFLFSFVVHFALDLAILFNVVLVGIFVEMWSEVEFVLLILRFPFVNFRGNILLINPATTVFNGSSVHLILYVGELRRKLPIGGWWSVALK